MIEHPAQRYLCLLLIRFRLKGLTLRPSEVRTGRMRALPTLVLAVDHGMNAIAPIVKFGDTAVSVLDDAVRQGHRTQRGGSLLALQILLDGFPVPPYNIAPVNLSAQNRDRIVRLARDLLRPKGEQLDRCSDDRRTRSRYGRSRPASTGRAARDRSGTRSAVHRTGRQRVDTSCSEWCRHTVETASESLTAMIRIEMVGHVIRWCAVAATAAVWGALGVSMSRAQSPADFAQANGAVRRLRPTAIPDLPVQVAHALEVASCTIPQPEGSAGEAPHNAILGHFTSPRTLEWAVLCSRHQRSAILIVNAVTGATMATVAERADVDFMQTYRGKVLGFFRNLEVVSADGMEAFRSHEHGQRLPRTIDHDGIDDQFIEKYSRVWYRTGAEWMFVAGSD